VSARTIAALLALAAAGRAGRAGADEDPRRFVDPTSWEVTITATCSGKQPGSVGPEQVTDTEDDKTNGKATVTRTTGDGSARRFDGPFQGTYDVSSTSVAVMPGLQTTMASTAQGDSGGPRVRVRLEIHADRGTYTIGVDQSEVKVNTKITNVTAGGTSVTTNHGTWNGDFLSDPLTLPPTGMLLKGTKEMDASPCHGAAPLGTVRFKRTLTWTAKPKSALKAVAGGPYEIERGQQVTLDGSKSEGHPSKFHWKLEPQKCPSAPIVGDDKGGKKADVWEKDGKTVTFTALCDLKATLMVSNDTGDTDTTDTPADVTVTARTWRVNNGGTTSDTLAGKLACGDKDCMMFGQLVGRNICAIDENRPNSANRHWLHRDTSTSYVRAQKGGYGYVIDTVTDGPFKGWSYVKEQNLTVTRLAQVHADLQPGSAVWKKNVNEGVDIATFAQSVSEHEAVHSELAFDEFAGGVDPATAIEPLVEHSTDEVKTYGDIACYDLDNRMKDASSEGKVHQRLVDRHPDWEKAGFIWVPAKNGWGQFSFASLAGVGDSDAK
jgi:hypothetical protein